MSSESIVLHADRFPMASMGMATWLRKKPNFHYLEQTIQNGEQALLAIFRQQPDIAVLDIALPKISALEIAETIAQNQVDTHVILWGESRELLQLSEVKLKALNLSVLMRCDVLKDVDNCLIAAQQRVAYSSQKYRELARRSREHNQSKPSLQQRFEHAAIQKLTKRERKVMSMIAGGNSTSQIANQLCLSNRTIDAHRLKIAKKLNLKGKNTLLLYAHENKDIWQCL